MKKKKCTNPYLAQQCISIRATLKTLRSGLMFAAVKDDGKIQNEEADLILDITKHFDALEKALDKYDFF